MARSKSVESSKSRRDVTSHIEPVDPLSATFGKPTQIYRFLKTRFTKSPLFLHRTLSYMKGRSTRRSNNKLRASFKIDSMKDRVENEEKNKELAKKLNNEEHLIIGFVSFYDNSLNVINVDVDTSLEKLPSKRKKDNNQGQSKIHIGSSLVVVNTEDNHTDKIPAVCISKSDFNNLGENGQMSYSLNFDIRSTNTQMSRKESINGQPPSKFQCLSKIYNAEICVFDKNGKNLIENGIYEIIANEGNNENRVNGVQSWIEQVNEICFTSDDEDTDHLAAFEKTPKIHLYLEWTKKSLTGKYINKPKILSDQHNNNNKENLPLPLPSEKQQNGQLNGIVKRENKPFLIQFVVNATTKQRTEESFEYECPWCVLKCPHLYGFVKHLKLSHSRFLFQFIDEGSKHRIDVFLNDMYDGSYSGAPHNVLMGSSSSCPQRRSVVTNIIVFRPRKPTFNMAEFQENDDACFDQQHQYISGHNRIYYHSETCVPIMPKELEYDSEGEPDPEWLQRTTKQMLDEFTDVNDGEKNLMKYWNLHVMKHLFVGDAHIQIACEMFVKEKGADLIRENLRNNYISHLETLRGHGLVSSAFLKQNIDMLDNMITSIDDKDNLKEETKKHRELCIKNWIEKEKSMIHPIKLDKEKSKKSSEPNSPLKQRRSELIRAKPSTPKTAEENGLVAKRKRNSN